MRLSKIIFRVAAYADIPSIIRLLADDELGSLREKFENPIPESYYSAYEFIDKDPNHELIVAELDGEVIGTLHLMFLPSLSFQGGMLRARRHTSSEPGSWQRDDEVGNSAGKRSQCTHRSTDYA